MSDHQDPLHPERADDELAQEIARRRRLVQSRMMQRWRRLLLTGAVSGSALAGAAGCESSQVCLSYIPTLQCPANPNDWILMEKAYPTATWLLDGDRWLVEVDVAIHLLPEDDGLIFTAGPTLTDATLVAETVADDHVLFTCEPHAEAGEVVVELPVHCEASAQALRFSMNVVGDPVAGGSVPVTQVTTP